MKLLKIIKEMLSDMGGLKIDNKPIRIVKYSPTNKFQIALINPENRLITATFGTQFPNEKQAEKFLCDNLPKIEEYFMQEDVLEEGIEGRFEIINKEIKCDI